MSAAVAIDEPPTQIGRDPMTGYEPQQGDEVTVQLRGQVSDLRREGFFLRSQAKAASFIAFRHVVSVEKVEPPKPPLPTTPGSVVESRGDLYVLVGASWLNAQYGYTCTNLVARPYSIIQDASRPKRPGAA